MGMAEKSVNHWVCTGQKNAFFRILGHFGLFFYPGGLLGALRGGLKGPYPSVHLPLQKMGATNKSVHHRFTTAQKSVFSLLEIFWLFLSPWGPSRGPLGLSTHQKVAHFIALCSKCHDTLIYKRSNACLREEKLFTMENCFYK